MRRQQLSPVNLNLKAKELACSLTEILKLTDYGAKILTVLLAAPRPLKVLEINNFCKVPRTKIYGAIKKLVDAGLATQMMRTEEDVDKPEIYEYWPEKNQVKWATRNNLNVKYFAPNLPYLKDLYITWSTEYYSRKLRIGQLLETLEEQSQDIPTLQIETEQEAKP